MAAGQDTVLTPAATLPAGRMPGRAGALLLLSKPGIVLAEGAAGLTGMLLAVRGLPLPAAPLGWGLFTLLLAASGAAMANCVLDADADRKMLRLTARSQALSRVGSRFALTLALLQMALALLLAGLFLNRPTVLLLLAACAGYLLLYTCWLKRTTPWGVLAGALPGALPPLIGAAAVSGRVAAPALLLALWILLWQVPHFWLLALRYRPDYRRAAIPVLAVTCSRATSERLTLASALLLLPMPLLLAWATPVSGLFLLLTLLAGGLFALRCRRALRSADYRAGFIASLLYLAVIMAAIMVETLTTPA